VRQNILLSGYSVFTNGMVSIKIQNKQGISFEQANGKLKVLNFCLVLLQALKLQPPR
jgi:hypothetical protein